MGEVDRVREHEVGAEADIKTDVLATPDEEMSNVVQIQKLAACTVRPGLLRLDVSTVTTAENSPQMVVIADHPVEGDIRFFFKKIGPDKTWATAPLRELLEWYGYTKRSMYQLQTDRVYVKYVADIDEYVIVQPPSDWERKLRRWRKALAYRAPDSVGVLAERLTDAVEWVRSRSLAPSRSHARMLAATYVGIAALAAGLSLTESMTPLGAAFVIAGSLASFSVAGAVFAPAGGP